MLGVGAPEVLVILVVALLVFGPKSLPGVARGVGKATRELRRLATEFQREVNLAEAHDEENRRPAPAPPRVEPARTETAPQADAAEPPPAEKGGA